jgi:hypothetical protein
MEDRIPLLQGKTAATDLPVFFLCRNYACEAPTESLEEVEAALRE